MEGGKNKGALLTVACEAAVALAVVATETARATRPFPPRRNMSFLFLAWGPVERGIERGTVDRPLDSAPITHRHTPSRRKKKNEGTLTAVRCPVRVMGVKIT